MQINWITKRKRIWIVVVVVLLIAAGLIAVQALDVLAGIFSLHEQLDDGTSGEEVYGNTAGNIANDGIAAISGEWIYYYNISDDSALYRIRTGWHRKAEGLLAMTKNNKGEKQMDNKGIKKDILD